MGGTEAYGRAGPAGWASAAAAREKPPQDPDPEQRDARSSGRYFRPNHLIGMMLPYRLDIRCDVRRIQRTREGGQIPALRPQPRDLGLRQHAGVHPDRVTTGVEPRPHVIEAGEGEDEKHHWPNDEGTSGGWVGTGQPFVGMIAARSASG